MSKIKNTYNNIEDIPAGLENHYSETEAGYTFNGVDGMVDKGRLNEFRDNNIQLRKDIESRDDSISTSASELKAIQEDMAALESKFAGVDLEEWSAIQTERKAISDRELIEAGDVDKLIDSRVNEVLAAQHKELETQKLAYENQISSLQGELVSYDGQLNTMLVDNELAKVAGSQGVRASAVTDLLSRGNGIFRVENGVATAFGPEGRPMYDTDAVTPLSITRWVEGLTTAAPHLFEASTGAGMAQPTAATAPAAVAATPFDSILAGLVKLNK